jgi:predicted CoA-substrate-specific enzyme activase
MKRLGVDIGSHSIGCVLIEDGTITETLYRPHRGGIECEIRDMLALPQFRDYDLAGVCGAFPDPAVIAVDSMLAVIEGARFLLPGCRNVLSIGGETFSLVLFDEHGGYREHTTNSPCASGTGSFIEQQAERLHLSVQELSRRASAYAGKPPLIATRCAVFAKTDITHAMQEGHSFDAICAGLCEGIARNVLDVLVKGRELTPPVGFVGGVSQNAKIVDVFRDTLRLPVVVPEHAETAGAAGAALLGVEQKLRTKPPSQDRPSRRKVRIPLEMKLTRYPDFSSFNIRELDGVEIFLPADPPQADGARYLGIDIGSTSTKAVLIDERGWFLGGFYTRTGGEPIRAVGRLLRTVESSTGGARPALAGAATTGSGRKMIKGLFRAEMDVDEITAHAKAAVSLNPEVDTIIEIGGQDSKFTRVRDGEVYFSTMNYVCAAGTGSFIEEQAKRLDVNLEQFADLAFGARAPYTSDRCTVYMERDLGMLLAEGWSKESLAAAVLNSVRDNYLAKVVGRNPIGDYVVFQGATGRNRALIASFEQLLEKPLHVSPFCHLTGALGAALICREEGAKSSGFLWDVGEDALSREVCTLCANHCVLTVVERDGVKTGWGMKCGREYADNRLKKPVMSAPEQRFHRFTASFQTFGGGGHRRAGVTIGIPRALYNVDYAPLWHSFLSALGFSVRETRPLRPSLSVGKKVVNSDFCAPMILAHGYMEQMLHEGVDYLFYPAVVNERDPENDPVLLFKDKTRDAYYCYYSQYLPTIVSKLTSFDIEEKLISPLLHFNYKDTEGIARDIHDAMKMRFPDLKAEEVLASFARARSRFDRARKEMGTTFERMTSSSPRDQAIGIALMGRPYVLFDPVLNLGIPAKLEELGGRLFWQDEFDLEGFELSYARKYHERMHWHYGRRIVRLAEYCAQTDNLFAVYLTCFRCSPDSFLISYVKDIFNHYEKPFLILQLDELSSDTGYTTRMEAGLRSFRNHLKGKTPTRQQESPATTPQNDRLERGDTVLIPFLDQLISGFWVDCFAAAGYEARLLDADERSLNTGYQYVNGGECLPLASIIGGVVEQVKTLGLRPEKTFLYLPTVCLACNFPQFPVLSSMAFRSAGLEGLKIGLINSMAPGTVLSQSLSTRIFQSYIIGCIIYKMFNRIKPYERDPSSTESAMEKAKNLIGEALRRGTDLRTALGEAAEVFRVIERDESGGRKPRIGLIGDLYVKYNDTMNQKIQTLVEELGGELVIPSMTEYPFHFYDADIRLHGGDPRSFRILRAVEQRFEKIAADIIGDQLEPDFEECVRLMEEYKIRHYIAGETSINVGRALYYISRGSVDAILHINPMFCCPGVVTSSIYRKIQEDFGIPIIDIFYDGTGNPNSLLIPHMYYLQHGT